MAMREMKAPVKTFRLSSPIVFDNDCLASFLWTRRAEVPRAALDGKLMVPEQVVREFGALRRSRYAWVCALLDSELGLGNYEQLTLPTTGSVAKEYANLTTAVPRMGDGEASALAYVRFGGGTIASNNLSDVSAYCQRYGLELLTTEDILCLAVTRGSVIDSDASGLWDEMKKWRRRLPPYDFSAALRKFIGKY